MPPKPPNARKAKLFSSRAIRSENSDPSIKDGILSIPEFLSSREYEIRAFEQSQLNTKYASSTRVFQSLPRLLRRRTASHNVKRIPKRLRAKALREMQNTVNGVPDRKPHLRGRELHRLKIRKRMLRLASEIKALGSLPAIDGATMKEKLLTLNHQIKELSKNKQRSLNNAVGAYDNSAENRLADKPKGNLKFAHRQKEFVWLPTHIWHAKRFHMMKNWGYQIPFSPNQKCFRATSRAAKQGCLAYETSHFCEMVVQCQTVDNVKDLLLTFTKYENPVPQWLVDGSRVYDDWIYCDEKRVCTGSIFVCSGNQDVLIRLHPSVYSEIFERVVAWGKDKANVIDSRFALGSIELHGPTALNSLAKILHLDGVSSKTQDAWKLFSQANDSDIIPSGTAFSFFVKDPRYWKHPVRPPFLKGNLNSLLVQQQSYLDKTSLESLLLPQGRTDSYKDMWSIKQLGKHFAAHSDLSALAHGASKFPILIFKKKDHSWCVSLPWFWVVPLWSKLVQVNHIKVAGARQHHQINFEHGMPTFPHDFPFLPEGYKEYIMKQKAADIARAKLPASKQAPLNFEGPLKSGCDWFFLRKWRFGLACIDKTRKGPDFGEFSAGMTRKVESPQDLAIVIAEARDNDGGLDHWHQIPVTLYTKSDPVHASIVAGTFKPDISKFPSLPVKQVRVTVTGKGHLSDNARVYEAVANPDITNLIGFVTTGSFNFNEGNPTGIAVLSADYKDQKVFIRNVGCTTFSAGKIEKI